jgi:hypothetical protein
MSDEYDDRPAKGRSRSYPSLSVLDAVDKATLVWNYAKRNKLPVAKITELWGYKSATTGPATTSYAALKKYGLLVDEGNGTDRRGQLTELALEAINKPDPSEALFAAAMTPPIIREFWEKYGPDVPPIEALHWDWVVQGGFTDSGLADFLRVYKANIPVIQGSASAMVDTDAEQNEGDDDDPGEDHDDTPGETDQSRRRTKRKEGSAVVAITVPVPGFAADEPAVVEFPGKLSESEWTYFIAVLTAMKDGVLREPDQPTT